MTSLLGSGYESIGDEETVLSKAPAANLVAAPDVSLEVWSPSTGSRQSKTHGLQDPMRMQMMLANPTDNALTYNVTYDNLARPAQGPAHPFKSANGNSLKRKNVLTGTAEETNISDATFNAQHRTFQSLGYTKDPSLNGGYVGDQAAVVRHGGKDVIQMRPTKEASAVLRAKRQKKGDSSIVEGEGAYIGPWAKYQNEDLAFEEEAALADRELASDEEWVEEEIVPVDLTAPPKAATDYSGDKESGETTEFVGSSEFDYQGRTYMHIPQDLDIDLRKEPGSFTCYIPKKLVHSFKSHTKPITAIQFFPHSGHLMLSASADSTVKIWDAHHSRELLRNYSGHNKSITTIDFQPHDGSTFLTASYDRQMKLWDTETGKVISKFSTGKIPHCLKFHPNGANTNEFIAGMSDKKIVQFDIRSGEMTQEYDHHLGPINSLTFVDEDRRFISTSDDKSLRAWEYNIPVPIKFIAEPHMFALTRAAPHPNGKYVAFQSSDNQIVVYSSQDKFRQNRKKSFRGHNNAGYAIDIAISPDGQFLASGDSGGFLCFWDWKTGKMYHKILTGKDAGACTTLAWNPQETSKVATGGLDGIIRYWD